MDPEIVFGLTASGVVMLIMQVLKYMGLADRWWPWATLALSVLSVALSLLLRLVPGSQIYIEAFVSVFAVFLLTVGEYHGLKNIGQALGLTDGNKGAR